MKTLKVLDLKNYDDNYVRSKREAVRSIIIKNGKIALIKSLQKGHYQFPGGGVDDKEEYIDALIRETKEEAGLIIKIESIQEYGLIHEIRKSGIYENTIFDQKSYYYFADIEETSYLQQLTKTEEELGYILVWEVPSVAYEINNELIKMGDKLNLLRDTIVLEMLLSRT